MVESVGVSFVDESDFQKELRKVVYLKQELIV